MKKAGLGNKRPNYPTLGELKTKKFLNIATALGIGVSAAAISLDVQAGEKKVTESKKVEKSDQKKLQDKIILLAANLGHKDFKEREKSTKDLIALGKKFNKEKKTELNKILKAEVQKQSKSKDPEVKERSKKILLALTPPPPKRNNHHIRTAGIMIER